MKPEPIYINPGTFTIAGTPVARLIQSLTSRIEQLQQVLGTELNQAVAGISNSSQTEPTELINFTGVITGMSTLFHFCSFTRGIIALEKGMETQADKDLVGKLRELLVPIVTSQCEMLRASITSQLGVKTLSIRCWYEKALAEVQAIDGFIGRLG